jgi:hypothetical protein
MHSEGVLQIRAFIFMYRKHVLIFSCLLLAKTIHAGFLNAGQESPLEEHASAAEKDAPERSILFTPPAGWRMADAKALPPSVKAMVIGKGAHEFPPSINLGMEIYPGTLKQYLNRIKDINKSQGTKWKDLGEIRIEAGKASLSQVDKKTEWGDVRMMHVILNREGVIYILTAAALKEEFPGFYTDFFNSLCSLRFSN